MVDKLKVDICVIGAGAGGLSVAAGAAMMGASTALVEKGKMGGDCLNYGCVPSKALLAAGHAAESVRRARDFGIEGGEPVIDFPRVQRRVHDVIEAIAPTDSAERFEGLGVKVIKAEAQFTGPSAIAAGDTVIEARRFVVATGSSPAIPPIPGLAATPYRTNETIFDLTAAPEHLIVIGAGPIGVELAQAHRHLGAPVTIIEMLTMLPNEDPELTGILRQRLVADGIDLREGANVAAVERQAKGIAVRYIGGDGETKVEGSDLLIATGRQANVDGLELEAAGIAYSPRGIEVDRRLRTTNRRVFAIGDVVGGQQFTHLAGYHAGIVVRNALFRLPAKANHRVIPRVTYTAPELAQIGMTEEEARQALGRIRVLRWPFAENDRARAEGETDGLVKLVTDRRGRIAGAGIVGSHAGELIQLWVLALAKRMSVGDIAKAVMPYPTLGEINKRASSSFFLPKLTGARARQIVRLLSRLG